MWSWGLLFAATTGKLSVADLDILLAWHQAPKTKGAKKADKLQ